jgi:hypothetical protein
MSGLRATRRNLAIAVALGSACALPSAAGGRDLQFRAAASHPVLDSGIIGEVIIGPTCPVERPGKTCERPYRATIEIQREATQMLVARVQSSALGRFRIALAPGAYLLLPENGRPYPRSSQQVATVRAHRYTRVVISYDSGIR